MRLESSGLLISARKYGETSAVVRIFSHQHGICSGLVKGAMSKSRKADIMPGNMVKFTWNARLAEHLGMISLEMEENFAGVMISEYRKLAALQSACALIEAMLHDHDPHEELYEEAVRFLQVLKHSENYSKWLAEYVRFEMEMLTAVGFGLDLESCAASGTNENLKYVSPKSGRAVCEESGEPYKDKLLQLPDFLRVNRHNYTISMDEIASGLKLTGYFLLKFTEAHGNRPLPESRTRVCQLTREVEEGAM